MAKVLANIFRKHSEYKDVTALQICWVR